MARQLAEELAIPWGTGWRLRGYFSDDLAQGAASAAPQSYLHQKVSEIGSFEDGCIVAAREERLLDIWCRRLQGELLEIDAPVLTALKGSLDPDRAAQLLVGRTRATTLKRYLSYYRQWRLWLAEAKLRYPPGRPTDLVDYLLARRDEPCGRTVPEAT
ncbi:unnamed protein product [Symbiodinium microadriaticum]|nr:unnamed protein product [Symbiodinium microadriaticum]